MEELNRNKNKDSWINGIFFLVTLVVNTLGGSGVINGLSQKEISDRYITLITPSPSTFSIWGVIYLLLLASVIVMIVKKDKDYYQKALGEISLLFRISCVLNAIWIIAFSFVLLELSVMLIFAFLIVLSIICMKLKKIHTEGYFLLPLTFGLYTGWLFIATVVNIAAALVKLKWKGFGMDNDIWAILMVIIAVILVFIVLQKNRNAVFPLPIAWAFLGIFQFLNSPDGFKGEYKLLQIVVLAGMAILIGMAAIQLYINHFAVISNNEENKI